MPGDSAENVPGHFIDIAVESDQARVEDILTLAAKTSPPLMQGAMTLKAHLEIPPGKVSVSKKMQGAGDVCDSRGDVQQYEVAGDGGQAHHAGERES